MKAQQMARILGLIGVLLALNACEGVRDQLGMTKQSPDEFKVVARAPLTLPPEYSLRPPQPGMPRPQEGTATQQAREAVFRIEQPKTQVFQQPNNTAGRSPGEMSLLKAAGAQNVDPKIREVVDLETQQINSDSDDFIEMLVFWRDKEIPGVVVDAEAEARRLRANAALGRPATAGETPTIERRDKALFEGLF